MCQVEKCIFINGVVYTDWLLFIPVQKFRPDRKIRWTVVSVVHSTFSDSLVCSCNLAMSDLLQNLVSTLIAASEGY